MRMSGTLRISPARFAAMICAACLMVQVQIASAQTGSTITVQVDKPGAAISPTLFGLFFEDINFGVDGGLYPERVKNRSFEFPDPWMAWKQLKRGDAAGALYMLNAGSVKDAANAHYLRMKAEASDKGFGGANNGFQGK